MTTGHNTTVEMDLYKVAQNYVDKILAVDSDNDDSKTIRVLLLDSHTAPIISLVSTQSDLLKKEIYLVDRLENQSRDKLRNLKCICFLKPSDLTITNLSHEISNPKYSSYELYFNNLIFKSRLERLAESDDLEIVNTVVEVFQDYYVLNKSLFSATNILNPLSTEIQTWDPVSLENATESLTSLILSLNMKPIIKYESNSKMAFKLANSINYEITSNSQLFDQLTPKRDVSPLLLILDRKNDPITPLLFPWTYQSMINELLGIGNSNNNVDLSYLSNVSDELKTVIMNETQDPFYSKSMYMNFGDLSTLLKQYVDDYKSKTKTNSNISSIKDMKFFLENYPEYKKMSLNLSKHMLLTSEIDKQINSQRIWETSEFEQTMCSNSDTSNHEEEYNELESFIFDKPRQDGVQLAPVSENVKLKLFALYALKYETYPSNKIDILLKKINNSLFNNFIAIILKYAGHKSRMAGDDGSIFNKLGGNITAANHVAALFNNISGNNSNNNENAFMQHQPRLSNILDKIIKGKFNSTPNNNFVTVGKGLMDGKIPPREVVIFIVGGVCYEEERIVNELNKNTDGVRIVLGGTHTLNSTKFIENLKDVGGTW
ncbi:vacuolar protein sorting-associated protein 45 [Pichia californica]|uniref:Vacuolar protein sorting-associated protein 45 n=1 Tax=Pichia californica TaxID=460514 RepID=A0A9P6WQE2_9ASCO|nr:vacuolar protein sorting-associated protein 45 [[Candida] californica]KAG0691319.1 vacuolar protein sorting-associated protein 45 [[Candida] californica]